MPLVGSSVVPLIAGVLRGSVVGVSVTTGIPVQKIYNKNDTACCSCEVRSAYTLWY